jgi:hypothetical protein
MGRRRSRTSTQKVILDTEFDDSGFNAASAGAERLLDDFDRMEAMAARALDPLVKFEQTVESLVGPVSQLDRVVDATDDTLKQQASALDKVTDATKETTAATIDYGERAGEARKQVEQFGDVATNVSQISGAFRGFGVGGVADIIMPVADLADFVEGIGRLGPAMEKVGESVADAIPGINSANQGLLALGVGGAAAAGTLGLLAVAIGQVGANAARAREEAEAAETARLQGAERANAALVDADLEGRQELLKQAGEQNDLIFQAQAEAFTDMQNAATSAAERFSEFTIGADQIFDIDMSGALDTQEEFEAVFNAISQSAATFGDETINEFRGTFDGASAQLDKLDEQWQENIAFAEALSSEYALQTVAANEAANSTKALAGGESALAAKREETAIATERAAAAADKYTESQTASSEAARDAAIAQLDAQRETAAFIDELRGIGDTSEQEAALEAASEGRIDNLNKAFDKFADGTEKRIADITRNTQANVLKAQQEFMRESSQENAKFLEQERQQQESSNRERLRLIEDLNDDLLGAEEANDVVRFIQIQRAGEKNLRRLDEDASVEQQQRTREFIFEQKQRRTQFKTRLADIKAAGAQRIQAERDKLAERRQLLAQQIADERTALIQQISDARSAAVEQIRLQRERFFRELRDRQMHNAQMEAIEAQHQSNLRAIALQAQRIQTKTLSSTSTSFAKRQTISGSGLTPFTKAGSSSTQINIGSIGDGLSLSQVKTAMLSMQTQVENARRKASVR